MTFQRFFFLILFLVCNSSILLAADLKDINRKINVEFFLENKISEDKLENLVGGFDLNLKSGKIYREGKIILWDEVRRGYALNFENTVGHGNLSKSKLSAVIVP